MKKEIKKLIKRILLWIFKDRVEVFHIQQSISDFDMIQSHGEVESYIKRDIAIKIGEELLNKGFLEIEKEYDPRFKAILLRAKLYCIKIG